MDDRNLQLFCRQLGRWAEAAIEDGRSPFRRAETYFPLLTASGERFAPLVLWINRDSFMAGGLLLFPSKSAEEEIPAGLACADALGLNHFVTWAPREITFWGKCDEWVERYKSLPLSAAGENSPAGFRNLFGTVLEELKYLSVTGSIPPADLSPYYLANLCRLARQSATPFLAEAFRMSRGGQGVENAGFSTSQAAIQEMMLTLLRLMGLLLEDRLPPAIQPEGLDRALRFALDTLPQALRRPLEITPWELPLPAESAVRLHHLCRRLTQLRFGEDRCRSMRTLEILLASERESLGGSAPPPNPEEEPAETLFINPERRYPAVEIFAEIGPPSLLAFIALLRHLHGEPPRPQAPDLFTLGELGQPGQIRGTLHDSGPPPSTEHHTLAARLRLSWPNRRFPLSPRAPRWLWEFLHLLGLSGDRTRIALNTPDSWLLAGHGFPVLGLLREQFAIESLKRQKGCVQVHLRKGPEAVETTLLARPDGERRIPWIRLREEHPSLLVLALDLPDRIFSMLEDGRLQVPSTWPTGKDRGIYLFSRSSLGRILWQVVSGGQSLPTCRFLSKQFQRQGFPLPAEEVLHHLQNLPSPTDKELPAAVLDRELALWVREEFVLEAMRVTDSHRPVPVRRQPIPLDTLAERIRDSVFIDGLPQFPEHYLFDYYRPQLTEYRLRGPLTAGEEFFGRITLHAEDGETFTVEGSETARALLLVSFSGRDSVALPSDRRLTENLLQRYLADLNRLHLDLVRQVHRQLTDARTADNLVERIWNSLPLPPWSLITG